MAGRETPAPAPAALPRFCSAHPDLALVTLHDWRAPIDVRGQLMRCPAPGHLGRDDHRCAWCGGPIIAARLGGTVSRPYRAVFCASRCRLAAWRAEKRGALGRAPR